MKPIYFDNSIDKTLYIDYGLIFADIDLIHRAVIISKGVEKIYFWSSKLSEGFLETDIDDTKYIIDFLGHKDWFDPIIEIEEPQKRPSINFNGDSELDSLIFLKRNIDPSIQIEFNHLDDGELKILKKYEIL